MNEIKKLNEKEEDRIAEAVELFYLGEDFYSPLRSKEPSAMQINSGFSVTVPRAFISSCLSEMERKIMEEFDMTPIITFIFLYENDHGQQQTAVYFGSVEKRDLYHHEDTVYVPAEWPESMGMKGFITDYITRNLTLMEWQRIIPSM